MAMLSFMTLEPVAPATASFLRLAACACHTHPLTPFKASLTPSSLCKLVSNLLLWGACAW